MMFVFVEALAHVIVELTAQAQQMCKKMLKFCNVA